MPRNAFRSTTIRLPHTAVALLLASFAAPALVAQEAADPSTYPLYTAILGDHSWPVTTQSSEAQAYFDQGVRLMYAYAPSEARRSFSEARRHDPSCGMCWWGLAWSMGPYFNGAMSDTDIPEAVAAIRSAETLRAGMSPVESALIGAMASRYAPRPPSSGRAGLDSLYAREMERVYASYPEHAEVATLFADAMMLLEPRRGTWSLEKPSILRIHEVLEGVLEDDPGHPGACHAYVHATETTPKAGHAERCADLLGASIPGASHINHMPSHTYNRVGRWGDATAANVTAWHSDLKAEHGEGFAIYPAHNLHMLLFSAAVDGQGAISIQAAKDYGKLVPGDGSSFQALTLVRFGRFDEALELTAPPTAPIHLGLWSFARGLAHLRLGAADSAALYLSRVDSLGQATPATQTFRVHTPAMLLGTVAGILRGEILREDGRFEEALAVFHDAVRLQNALTYDEPEPLPFKVEDFLGAALLEAGRPAEAQLVFEAALVGRPRNGWSLKGLELSLRAQGMDAQADDARDLFEEAWTRSEVWLTSSRF